MDAVKVTGGSVVFLQRSAAPVWFDGGTSGVPRADLVVPAVSSVCCSVVPRAVVGTLRSVSAEVHNDNYPQPQHFSSNPVTRSQLCNYTSYNVNYA